MIPTALCFVVTLGALLSAAPQPAAPMVREAAKACADDKLFTLQLASDQ